jgi:glycosyltransferase involved in cell wall biosynthesis
MKIVHFTSVHDRYDIRIFHKMCVSLSQFNHDVSLVVADDLTDEVNRGVKIFSTGKPSSHRIFRMISGAIRTYHKANSIPADIYQFHDPELIFFGLFMALKGKKVIFDSHEDIPKDILDKDYINIKVRKIASILFGWIEKYLFRYFSVVITSTPNIESKMRSYGVNSYAIRNFPILSEFKSRTSLYSRNICYIGGITSNRGIAELIDALDYVNDVKLILAGNFSDEDFELEIKSKKNWSKVDYRGVQNREGISKVLSDSSIGMVTLHPANNFLESLPIKMFEYMAAGLPVIISNFPLWMEIVENNKCGVSVDPLNPEAIAKKINEMFTDFDKLYEMGKIGSQIVKTKYNWEIESQKLNKVYNSINLCTE